MRDELIRALRKMSDAESQHLWNAVSQWADNMRNHRDELDDDNELSPTDQARLEAAEKIEKAGDEYLTSMAAMAAEDDE